MIKCLYCTNAVKENKKFCSVSCSTTYRNLHRDYSTIKYKRSLKMRAEYNSNPTLCGTCNTPLLFEKRKGKFCSHSCAARENNKGVCRWTHTPPVLCACGNRKSKKETKQCLNCKVLEYGKRTVNDLIRDKGGFHHQAIRLHARMMLKRAKIGKTCKLCTTDEFDSIVEVCHIKAIASFYPDTELEIINHITNLVYLCPNHHKMFDRGLIKLTSMV